MSQVLKSSDLFISSYFEHESSSNPLLNKITHSNLVRTPIEQAQAYLQITWFTYSCHLYSKTRTNHFTHS